MRRESLTTCLQRHSLAAARRKSRIAGGRADVSVFVLLEETSVFVENPVHAFTLIHVADRRRLTVTGNPMGCQSISPDESKSVAMFAVSAVLLQSVGAGALKHTGDEELLDLSDRFAIEVEGEKTVLEPADSVFIPRGRRHRSSNIGTQAREAVFALSPAEY